MTLLLTLIAAFLTRFADPFVGTDAHGHTFPGAVAPFGMIQLSPDTRPNAGDWDGCSGYHYSDSVIYGFSHTHLSGTGCDDWCDVLVTPGASTFRHSREKAKPGFYSVRLDNGVRVRLAAGRRSAMHEYTFSKGPASLSIDLRHRDVLDEWEFHCGPHWCSGKRVSTSWAEKQQLYFYMEFSEDGSYELTDEGKVAVFTFPGRKVSVRVSISSVSEDNARQNLMSEYPQSLRALKKAAKAQWEAYLGKLKCPYKDREHKRRFYTALYHTGIHPSLYSDSNGEYRGMDGEVHRTDGWERYTVFSTWDTFRGEHPLLFEIEPARSVDFIRSMISIYEENGKLPVWELSGYETDCMIGYNSAPVIAEAVARGLGGFDVRKAYEAMKASSLRPEYGLSSFRRNGLVLADDEHESVSKTLEYSYDDWCVAQVAKALGEQEDYEYYMRSSQYWRNVLDPSTGFMRARLNGRWFSPFDPREVNNNYTEANSWQYSFFVPHDVPGLVEALGGTEAFEARLDSLFTAPEGTTGREQADITGCIGQYAHGNEPSHHIPWLYAAIGKPEKTQAIVNKILETLYSSAPDGLCGNDDCGQMSAWYVLSSLGRYPVCPGSSGEPQPAFEPIVTNPWFDMESEMFADTLSISIGGEEDIFYRISDGEFKPYEGPVTVNKSCSLEAYSQRDGKKSFVTRTQVNKFFTDRDINIFSQCSRMYSAGGPQALIDTRRGGLNWRTGGWQGYQGTDFEAVVDLRSVRHISGVGAGFMQDARSWIWMPRSVEFSASRDGVSFEPLATVNNTVDDRDYELQIWDCTAKANVKARYVKVVARTIGTIPEWHPGAGCPGYIFIDEICVNAD